MLQKLFYDYIHFAKQFHEFAVSLFYFILFFLHNATQRTCIICVGKSKWCTNLTEGAPTPPNKLPSACSLHPPPHTHTQLIQGRELRSTRGGGCWAPGRCSNLSSLLPLHAAACCNDFHMWAKRTKFLFSKLSVSPKTKLSLSLEKKNKKNKQVNYLTS